MAGLFPMVQPELAEQKSESLPLCREVAWDFKEGKPLFRGGAPVTVEGTEAVKVWIWKALMTERTRYPIYSWNFGCEVETLLGQNYSEELKRAEAARYVREALEINPYIAEIERIGVSFGHGLLKIDVRVKTVYGEVEINV